MSAEHLVMVAVYVIAPAALAAVTGALIRDWKLAAGLVLLPVAGLILFPSTGLILLFATGVGLAALLLVPLLLIHPDASGLLRAVTGAAPLAALGLYVVFSNPGIV